MAAEAASVRLMLAPDWAGRKAADSFKSAADELANATSVMAKLQRLADEDDA